MSLHFAHPGWLVGGAAALLALLALWRGYDRRQQKALERFVASHLRVALTHSVSAGRRRLQRTLLALSIACLFAALAQPQLGFRWELVSRRGIQIMFAIDTSRSMSTPDVRPNRLSRAKLAIDDFTRKLDGDAVGLIAFAGDAFVVCPVTLDYGAFHESLAAIDTGIVPRGGTNISLAIEEAQAALRRRADTDKILILVTDGENLEGDALDAAKEASKEDNLKIYTVGVGTPQGDLIPLAGQGTGAFLKDDAGNFVRSHLDEPALKSIADATGGLYAPLGAEGQGFDAIYRQSLAPLLKHDLLSRQQRVPIERFQWPLAASLGLLLLSQLIGNRRGRARRAARRTLGTVEPVPTRRSKLSTDTPTAGLIALGLAVGAALVTRPAPASPSEAEKAYSHGDYAAAARQYAAEAKRDPAAPALEYNLGAAQYRAGDFAAAAQAFQKSINAAPSGDAARLAEQQDAYYNLGNTLYRAGQRTEDSNPQQTLDNWNQAVKAYDTALAMRPGDADSKFNRDFVKRKIDALKQKQPPQNQQGQGPQNQDQNQNNQNNQNKQGQGQGGGQGGQGAPPNSQNPPPPQNQPPGSPPPNQHQGEPPPNGQNQGQPPPNGQNPGQPPPNGQKPGQPPPNGGNKGQPPPNGPQPPGGEPAGKQPQNGPPPPGGQGADQPPGQGTPKPADGQQNAGSPNQAAGSRRMPGQMSPDEARQLLDSQKGDERTALGMPYARRGGEPPPEKPVKDW